MERGPVALFSAIVAVGLGPALWLGVQFGGVEVEPNRPPAVSEIDPGGQEYLGGRGAGSDATTDTGAVVKTAPRANTRSITRSPSPSPSNSPTPTDPGPSSSPSETADPSDDPTATPTDPAPDPTEPPDVDPTIPPDPPDPPGDGDNPGGDPTEPTDGGGLGTGARVYEKEKDAEVKSGTEFGVILNRAVSLPEYRGSR